MGVSQLADSGAFFPVAPGQERVVLDICDGRDSIALCAYVASTR